MNHLSLSSYGKLHYKVVITQCSLCNVHISLSIYLSKRPIYVTQLTLSEINTILSKNFCFVTLTRTLDGEFLFPPFPLPPLPHPPFPTYSRSFPGKVLDHVISIVLPLSPPPTRWLLVEISSPFTFFSIASP